MLALGVLISGCLGGDDGPRPTGTAGPSGVVQGRVLDEAGLPLEGASVRALLLNLTTATDDAGTYELRDVPPGPLRLTASAPGLVSQTRDVDVEPNGVHNVEFQLEPLSRPPERYHRTLPFSGSVSCNVAQAGGCPASPAVANNTHLFPVEAGLRAIIVELDWSPTVSGTAERLRVELRAANATACGLPYAEQTGASPVRLDARSGFPLHGGFQCLVVTAPTDVTAVNQGYQADVTLFYHSDPPEGFTADGG